ncbi:hypothetical protein FDUTEX481_00484 [Tolypothrix sp. PCC 7601]|nr:hypothetical protein FDUTEX481_00484 [Tolypothrix sp. PCC 7601]
MIQHKNYRGVKEQINSEFPVKLQNLNFLPLISSVMSQEYNYVQLLWS